MFNNDVKVSLTYSVGGELSTKGRYIYSKVDQYFSPRDPAKKDVAGTHFPKNAELDFDQSSKPAFKQCSKSVILNEQFVAFATSLRGKPQEIGKSRWKQMSFNQRLHWHIKDYVEGCADWDGNKFSYEVLK